MSRINSSALWDYFDKTNADDKKAKCRVCGDVYSFKGTTGKLKAHLKKKHLDAYSRIMAGRQEVRAGGSTSVTSAPAAATTSTATITTTTLTTTASTSTGTSMSSRNTQQQTMDRYGATKKISTETKRKIDEDLLDLFVDSYQPFSLVEERSFKKYARWIPGYKLPSRKTVSNTMIPALYSKTQEEVKSMLGPNVKYLSYVRLMDVKSQRIILGSDWPFH